MASSSTYPADRHSVGPPVLTGRWSSVPPQHSLPTRASDVLLAPTGHSTPDGSQHIAQSGYPRRTFLVPRTEGYQPSSKEYGPTMESTSDEEYQSLIAGVSVRRRARYSRRYSLKQNDRVLVCVANEHNRYVWRHGVVCNFDRHPQKVLKSGEIKFAISYPLLSPALEWRIGYFNPSLSEVLYDNLLSRWQKEQKRA